MVCHNTIKIQPIQCYSMFLKKKVGCLNIKNIWNEIESQLFEKIVTEPIKKESKYVNGMLKMWKEQLKTDFRDQDVPYNMHCNATTVLKIDSVYKQGKNYHPQAYIC